MNPFVDPKKRIITFEFGCEDLINVLKSSPDAPRFKVGKNNLGCLIITAPGLRKDDIDLIVEKNVLRVVGKKTENSIAFESCVTTPTGYDVSQAHPVF